MKEDLKSITPKEVNEAAHLAEEEIAYELIGTLPEHQRLIIYAIALMSLSGGKYRKLTSNQEDEAFLLSGEIYDRYVSIARSLNKEPKSSRFYRRYIVDLEMQGIITTYTSGKGVRGHTRLIRLSYLPDKIKLMIEKGLFKENEAEEVSKPA